ncbi:MAG: FecR family protein [Methylomonas sp.]|nr:FecR family protein [Methylomonas sp.]
MKQASDSRRIGAIQREATDWWVRLDSGEMDKQQLQAFENWLAGDAAHADAFAKVTRLWRELDAIEARIEQTKPVMQKTPSFWLPGGLRAFGLPGLARWSAALAVCCLLFWLSPFRMLLQADYRTAIGEMRHITLSDGSVVHLNSDSALVIAFDAQGRQLDLLKGEALFEVSPDRSRPFRVHAGHGSVTALGTAFNIRLNDDETQVTVTEHSVAVDLDNSNQTVKLEQGQQLDFDRKRGISQSRMADIHAITAWQRGKLVFQNKPLGEVIAELNRYHRGFLTISDASIADRRVNGVFRTDDPLAVVGALQSSLQIKSTRISDYLIMLHH